MSRSDSSPGTVAIVIERLGQRLLRFEIASEFYSDELAEQIKELVEARVNARVTVRLVPSRPDDASSPQ